MAAQNYKPTYAATSPWGDEPRRQFTYPAAIEWVRVPVTPLPEVVESNSEAAWRLWDEAVRAGVFLGGVYG